MKHRIVLDKIEYLKQNLYKLIELQGIQSKEVLKCSQELDMLIANSYEKKQVKKSYIIP